MHTCAVNPAVESIRHATRQLVRELHLLDGRVECCGLPLSQCHLVTELNMLGETTASDLADRLVLEKSTMSRLVKTLVDGFQPAGEQAINWDGRDDSGRSTAAGTYLIQFRSRDTQQAERVVRLR